MARRYKRPPLQEALCEIRFLPSAPWDWTVPGLLWERISDRFPIKESKTIAPGEASAGQNLPLELREAAIRAQFFSESRDQLVQVGPDLLTVNLLPPYPGWPTFLPLTLEMLAIYRDIAKPSGIARLGVRFINRVTIPGKEIGLQDYFQTLPAVPGAPDSLLAGFLTAVDLRQTSSKEALRFTFGTANSEDPNMSAFLLDLDASLAGEDAPSWDSLESALILLHDRIESAFDTTFTDRTHREIFAEETG